MTKTRGMLLVCEFISCKNEIPKSCDSFLGLFLADLNGV